MSRLLCRWLDWHRWHRRDHELPAAPGCHLAALHCGRCGAVEVVGAYGSPTEA